MKFLRTALTNVVSASQPSTFRIMQFTSHTATMTKIDLAPHDFVAWVLGNITSVADLRERVKDVQLISSTAELINEIPPLHFIISDASGETAVLEPTSGELRI
jgi:choloylglycine hydrolase